MKFTGLIILLLTLLIVGMIFKKQHETTVVAPTGKKIKVEELPKEVQAQLDNVSKQAEKRMEDAEKQE